MASAAETTTTTTTPFQPSLQLKTRRPTTTAFASSITSLDASEQKFWNEKFGLNSKSLSTFTTIVAGSAAVVQQAVCDQKILVVACGPRVQLYGTSPQSSLNRLLRQQQQQQQQQESSNSNIITVADRQIPTGGQLALCAQFRSSDGQLLAIGTEGGLRIAQVSTRATLASWFAATAATRKSSSISSSSFGFGVRAVAWFRNGHDVLAVCDDALRVYRLSHGEGPIRTFRGHGDVLRCGGLWQQQQQQTTPSTTTTTTSSKQQLQQQATVGGEGIEETLAFTGSYDHSVRVWDLSNLLDDENDCCVSVLMHGAPVEAISILNHHQDQDQVQQALLPEDRRRRHHRPWLVSAGGTYLKVWNLQTGACLHTYSTHHTKTITSLLVLPRILLHQQQQQQQDEGNNQKFKKEVRMRLLTGGLDGYLGIHAWDSTTGALVTDIYGVRINTTNGPEGGVGRNDEGVTALGGTNDRLVIGTTTGKVYVRQKTISVPSLRRKREPPAGTYSFFTRGMNAEAAAGDYIVGASGGAENKKKKLREYDLALKQFRYGDALDEALGTRIPQVVVAVLEELGRRRGLTIALSNRDEESLEPILAFTVRYISRPRFSALLIGVANKLVDIYGDVSGQSETIDELFAKLMHQVSLEARVQRKLLGIVGQLDAIMTSAAMRREDDESE